MESNCCGAEPSYLSDELCGECLEWAEFEECNLLGLQKPKKVNYQVYIYIFFLNKNHMNRYTIKCEMCNYENHIDNFCCEGEDCGIPLDLEITENSFGLPEIKQK